MCFHRIVEGFTKIENKFFTIKYYSIFGDEEYSEDLISFRKKFKNKKIRIFIKKIVYDLKK